MAKVKVINNNLDQNLNGGSFNSTPSQTIFSFGRFSVTSNFDGRKYIDYSNKLSSFVRSITLETIGMTDVQSELVHQYNTNAVLNLDKSDLNTFIRFGSAYEYLRICIENIIVSYPSSIFMNSQISRTGNVTYFDYIYDILTDTCTFSIPINSIVNTFGISYNYGNISTPDNKELKNLNLSYDKYIIWAPINPNNNLCNVIGYTGNTSGRQYLMIKAKGNPFSMVTTDSAPLDFHIKPNNFIFEEFRALLNPYEKYILSTRNGVNGFDFKLKEPILLDDGTITYSDTSLQWTTSDKYNIDINSSIYRRFLESILTIGSKYDKIKTDLIARFLTPASIKTYDLTSEGKMLKLLKIYGREFDQLREFIDSLVYIDRVSYIKTKNIPDQLIKNLSRTFGWDYFSLVNENELVQSFLTIDENERDLNKDFLPAEIDIELWRRILMNTNYFWKSKGTRESIKSIFLLIGIPEPFINITEYVYTVDGKINPNTVKLTQSEFPSNSLPYDTSGYPVAPLETNNFYFQVSGDTDSGQAYMDVFRMSGFNLKRTIDNRKSWAQSGSTYRVDDTTSKYYQGDSKLVLNTKEVDIALDTARGVEYDIYEYIKKDFAINSSGYTLPYSYVNISLGFSGNENTFPLPTNYSSEDVMGDLEVRFNGILLNAPKSGNTTGYTYQADYLIDEVTKTFTLTNSMYAKNNLSRRDVIQATFIYSGSTQHSLSGVTVDYIVTRINANVNGTIIPLPSLPRGDVQVTINGIALSKGTPQFTRDYIVDSGNTQLVIQNPEVIAYLVQNPTIQVSYVEVNGSNDIYAKSEIVRVDNFNTNKIYFNSSANKYVYILNYKTNSESDVKVLVDGIALEPNMDYSINTQNLYEIFLPKGIKYGSIISVYYLIGSNSLFMPIISNIFGLGDISTLSFLEFIELIQVRMINARNRKTITDFKGGWYPSLLSVYVEYLKRGELQEGNPLLSNGYTFQNLYSFLSKYNSFFQKFINQLLPATIILRKGGLMIRNTVFTKQKHMYRRGVNLYSDNSLLFDKRGNLMIDYMGDDGSVFLIHQPPILYVETTAGSVVNDFINTGGENVLEKDLLTSYGMFYRINSGIGGWGSWSKIESQGSLLLDNYNTMITNVIPNTTYEYKAFVKSGGFGFTGQTLQTKIPAFALPSLQTITGNAAINAIENSGGYNVVCYQDVDNYGMQYREIGAMCSDIIVTPNILNYLSGGSTQNITICGDCWNTYSIAKDPSLSWIVPATPVPPALGGVVTTISATCNLGIARSGVVCYTPSIGTTKCVTVSQLTGIPPIKSVYMECDSSGYCFSLEELACSKLNTENMNIGECYVVSLNWNAVNPASSGNKVHCVELYCNSATPLYSCVITTKPAKNCNGTFPTVTVRYGDDIGLSVYSCAPSILPLPNTSSISISSVSGVIGSYMIGDPNIDMMTICAKTDTLI